MEYHSYTSNLAVQRKGRSDDLKSFDEMEKMTSEPEEMELPQNQDEEQTPGEAQGTPHPIKLIGDAYTYR